MIEFEIPFFRHTLNYVIVFSIFTAMPVCAKESFNPAFLSGTSNSIADLDYFKSGNVIPPGVYTVRLFFNNEYIDSTNVDFLSNHGQVSPCITVAMLKKLDVNISGLQYKNIAASRCVDVNSAMPGAKIDFDVDSQILNVSIPQSFLNFQAHGFISPDKWDSGINAAIINYSFSGNNSYGVTDASGNYLNLRSGINLLGWRLRDYSTWSNKESRGWNHINTYAEKDIAKIKSKILIGEGFTNSDIFDSFNFRGVRLESSDSMLPDSMRGFAPVVRGVANSYAKVTIKQNDYIIYQTYVPSGSFEIRDLYPTSNSGDLKVTVEEVDGSINSYTVPYSAVPLLQREGGAKYNMAFGQVRTGLGLSDTKFLQADIAMGLPLDFTLYGGSQFTKDFISYAFGGGRNFGALGALSMDITRSLDGVYGYQGYSTRFLYAKSLSDYGTNFQVLGYRYSTKGFHTLSESLGSEGGCRIDIDDICVYGEAVNSSFKKKNELHMSLSQRMGENGSLFLTGGLSEYWGTKNNSLLLQAGYNGSFWGAAYNITYSENRAAHGGGASVSFGVSVPLGALSELGKNNSYINYNVSSNQGAISHNIGISGTLLDDNSMNYNVQQAYSGGGGKNSGGAYLGYQNGYGNASIGYSYYDDSEQFNYDFSGGVLLHQDGINFSQPINSSAILVNVEGASGIGIDDSSSVSTNANGYAVIPYATPYHKNRVALDTSTFKNGMDIDENVIFTVPTDGAITRVNFRPIIGHRVLFTLMKNGSYIPFGSLVEDTKENISGIVGEDGVVYLSGVPDKGGLKITWGEGKSCFSEYTTPALSNEEEVLNVSLECHEQLH
ncbi:TPA: fimbrial biogenesis outer membrane usher protein [Aeromonas hydrophila]|uniref:fimbria/pilus outer membrane usher protein n=1 Tax=Aeromonas hydrophila TaxID=644 RepID=UPI0028D9FED9|nr:fimbrial biogenesis outer membrane usher protein [Aeromonas hydrophila]